MHKFLHFLLLLQFRRQVTDLVAAQSVQNGAGGQGVGCEFVVDLADYAVVCAAFCKLDVPDFAEDLEVVGEMVHVRSRQRPPSSDDDACVDGKATRIILDFSVDDDFYELWKHDCFYSSEK